MLIKKRLSEYLDKFNKKGTRFMYKDEPLIYKYEVINNNSVLYYEKAGFFTVRCSYIRKDNDIFEFEPTDIFEITIYNIVKPFSKEKNIKNNIIFL